MGKTAGRTMTWAVAAVLGLAVAFPPGTAAQGTQALAPTDFDLYCAGYFSDSPVDTDMVVLRGEDGGFKNEFVDRDIIYLTRGQGAAPGMQFMVVRPVRDVNPRESFAGQRDLVRSMGTLYAEIARIQVRVAHEASLTAEVTRGCEPILAGDLVIPLTPKSAPAYRTPKLVDRFAPASGKPTGTIVSAKEFQQSLGEGQIVYVNLGRAQGVQVGSYLRVFRTPISRAEDPFEIATREYLTTSMGQQMGRKMTRAELASLPRNVLGEVMVISVGEDTASGIITFSREEIVLGDMVEIE